MLEKGAPEKWLITIYAATTYKEGMQDTERIGMSYRGATGKILIFVYHW